MHRFFQPEFPDLGPAFLEGAEAHHLLHVLRIPADVEIELFDGRGRSAQARVVRTGKKDVELEILSTRTSPAPAPELTLAVAVPKGDRFDWLVEKAVELAVSRLVPLITARSIVDPREGKLERLRQTVIAACKQSRRDTLMELSQPIRWNEFLGGLKSPERCLLAHPGGRPLSEQISTLAPGPLTVAVGPEGGFTDEEAFDARQRGVAAVSLGDQILRIETAAIAVAAVVRLGSGGRC